jgi:uncharacterized damage-inducible protein DinB
MRKIFILIVLFSLNAYSQNSTITAFLEKWTNSKEYLLEVAKAMPEEHYDFKPTEREMTFGKQLLHIKANMDWLSSTYFSDTPRKEKELEAKLTKAEIIAELEESFDQVYALISKTDAATLDNKVEFFVGPKSKLQILNLLQDHVTHHRGQILVYLNLNGVKPPKYVGW